MLDPESQIILLAVANLFMLFVLRYLVNGHRRLVDMVFEHRHIETEDETGVEYYPMRAKNDSI